VAAEVTGGPATGPAARVEQMLILLALVIRLAYCVYATAATTVSLDGYRRPAWVLAALVLALVVSVGLGWWIWRDGAIRDRPAVLDTTVAAVVLATVTAALPPAQRAGPLNWSLGYAVGCAIWLAAQGWWRGWLAAGLGVVYAVAVLSTAGPLEPAGVATSLVNAGSPVLCWAMAAAIATAWRGVGAVLEASQRRAGRQRRELAVVAERQRLGREVHQEVLATLDLIADGRHAGTELRGRARAQSAVLRRAFADPGSADTGAVLAARVATLAAERAVAGWTIQVVDDELDREPAPAATEALCRALAGLVAGKPAGEGRVWLRLAGTGDGIELVIRRADLPTDDAVAAARSCLTLVSGTVEEQESLPGEARLMLWVPA
jgi:hypothetical protein